MNSTRHSTRQKIILIKLFEDIYVLKKFNSDEPILNHPLGIAYLVLACDSMYFPTLLEWLDETNEKTLGSNTLFFEKINSTVRVVDSEDSGEEDKNLSYKPFIMTKESFKNMIEQWVKKVENRRPPRAIIYWDDGKVRIETQDNWCAYVRNFFFNLWHRWKMRQLNKKNRKLNLLLKKRAKTHKKNQIS